MSETIDLLGRAPVMKPLKRKDEIDLDPNEDWKGEHFWRVTRNPGGGGNFNIADKKVGTKTSAIEKRRDQVVLLHASGLGQAEISRRLKIGIHIVQNDFTVRGLNL